MGFLFSTPLELLATHKYAASSHTFNRAVIAAYNNVTRYGVTLGQDALTVHQAKRTLVFAINPAAAVQPFGKNSTVVFYETKPEGIKVPPPTREVCYDLKGLFSESSPDINRGIKFGYRDEVTFRNFDGNPQVLNTIYEGWKAAKEANPNVYRMSFNPARYKRVFQLKELGYDIFQKLVCVNGKPYGLIAWAVDAPYAYELAMLTLYKDPEVRIVNDQNDCIIVHCLYQLFERGIEVVNLGTSAGLKGLGFFKKKREHFFTDVWSVKMEQ